MKITITTETKDQQETILMLLAESRLKGDIDFSLDVKVGRSDYKAALNHWAHMFEDDFVSDEFADEIAELLRKEAKKLDT